jgi:hypothetical protein
VPAKHFSPQRLIHRLGGQEEARPVGKLAESIKSLCPIDTGKPNVVDDDGQRFESTDLDGAVESSSPSAAPAVRSGDVEDAGIETQVRCDGKDTGAGFNFGDTHDGKIFCQAARDCPRRSRE